MLTGFSINPKEGVKLILAISVKLFPSKISKEEKRLASDKAKSNHLDLAIWCNQCKFFFLFSNFITDLFFLAQKINPLLKNAYFFLYSCIVSLLLLYYLSPFMSYLLVDSICRFSIEKLFAI